MKSYSNGEIGRVGITHSCSVENKVYTRDLFRRD